MELIAALGPLFGVSVVGNIFLYSQLRAARQSAKDDAKAFAEELEKARKAPAPTLTAEQLLHQMTANGAAILRVECLNPNDLFLRSPRG